jgi:hypothetical protein
MTRALLLASMVMGCAVAGCVHTDFSRTTSLVVPGRSPDCRLDLVVQGTPSYPYAVLGLVRTESAAPPLFAIGEDDFAAAQRVKRQACAAGAHGLMNVFANSELVRFGKGRWKSTTASALAFVYVDAVGRPLPAPGPETPAPVWAPPQ